MWHADGAIVDAILRIRAARGQSSVVCGMFTGSDRRPSPVHAWIMDLLYVSLVTTYVALFVRACSLQLLFAA